MKQDHMKHMRTFVTAFILMAALAATAFLWLDRPISFFAHEKLAPLRIFPYLTRIPEPLLVLSSLVFVAVGACVLMERPLAKFASALLLSAISVVVTYQFKEQLKFVFGRTWPETWINNNPSLIRDGAYGFNFFHGGPGYAAFPSGHTAAICAAVSVFWFCYPKYRWLYAALIAATVIGLIGANYHFLSDIIAGGFIGFTVGWVAVLLWDAGDRPRLMPSRD